MRRRPIWVGIGSRVSGKQCLWYIDGIGIDSMILRMLSVAAAVPKHCKEGDSRHADFIESTCGMSA